MYEQKINIKKRIKNLNTRSSSAKIQIMGYVCFQSPNPGAMKITHA